MMTCINDDLCINVIIHLLYVINVLSQFRVSAALKHEQALPWQTRQRHQRKAVLDRIRGEILTHGVVQSPLGGLHVYGS